MTGIVVLRRPVGRRPRARPTRSAGPAFAIAGRDGRRPLRGDLRRRAAAFAAARLVLGLRPARPRRLDARRLAGLLGVVRRPRRVALAPRPRGGRSARAAPPATRRRRRCRRRHRRAPRTIAGHRRDRELLGLDVGDLLPAQRHRHPRVGQRPDRVGRRDRPVLGVLVVVEEDAVALLLPPLRAWQIAGARRSTSRARASAARRTSGYVQRGSIRTLMWIPREPDVFGQPTSPTASSASRADQRDVRGSVVPRHAGHRVEVDPQLVGMVEVLGPDRVRVEVDAAEVGDPGEPGRVVEDDLVGRPAGRERQRRGPDASRAGSRAPASGRTAPPRRRRRTA